MRGPVIPPVISLISLGVMSLMDHGSLTKHLYSMPLYSSSEAHLQGDSEEFSQAPALTDIQVSVGAAL